MSEKVYCPDCVYWQRFSGYLSLGEEDYANEMQCGLTGKIVKDYDSCSKGEHKNEVNIAKYEVIEDHGIWFHGLTENMIEDEDRVHIFTDKSLKVFKLAKVSRYEYMCGVCKFYKNDRCENPLSKHYAIHVPYNEGCLKWIDEREGEEE